MSAHLVSDRDPAARPSVDNTAAAYAQVRRAILNGTLQPGVSISQVQLALQLSISRTPLREALRLLQTEGLVQSDYNRRVRVCKVSAADLEALTAMRLAAEPLGVRLAVPNLDSAALDAVERAMYRLHEGKNCDPQALADAHRRFHYGLWATVDGRLRRHIEDLWEHAQRYRLLYFGDEGNGDGLLSRADDEHVLILEAAKAGEAELCSRRVAEHVARSALAMLAAVDVTHDPTVVREAIRHVLEELPVHSRRRTDA